jgi:hypothetical protein
MPVAFIRSSPELAPRGSILFPPLSCHPWIKPHCCSEDENGAEQWKSKSTLGAPLGWGYVVCLRVFLATSILCGDGVQSGSGKKKPRVLTQPACF